MNFHLAVEGSYKTYRIALFEDYNCLYKQFEIEKSISSSLVCNIDQILERGQKKLKDLSFISVNCGPGAFTSLRTVISVLNGISFGSGVNLVPVDGLEALAKDSFAAAAEKFGKNISKESLFVPMLNAYSGECYYSAYRFSENNKSVDFKIIDCKHAKIDQIFKEIANLFPKDNIYFSGNGLERYKDSVEDGITMIGMSRCQILPINCCSVEQVGLMGFDLWKKGRFCCQIEPFYLKGQIQS
jgi:tRNA threonylcarbamoyl adenosine modification protein YeaZ